MFIFKQSIHSQGPLSPNTSDPLHTHPNRPVTAYRSPNLNQTQIAEAQN
ncbi:hypothetical protein F383_28387 [Gossypium arboreum]|uniref:Uncharacterized protein n=1 Tax=Gossypium arboreum TaxID=29729 RepID=A0A0B0PD48_GOSAR|nr:hypothetical protein F383_28387 [Gossypium arboreum]